MSKLRKLEARVPDGGVKVGYVMRFTDEETRLLARVASFHGVLISEFVRAAVMEKANLPQLRFEVPA